MTTAAVLGNAPTALYAIRELRNRPGDTLGIHTQFGAAALSRYARHERWHSYPNWIAQQTGQTAIVATADDALEALAATAGPPLPSVHGDPSRIGTLLDKERFYPIARQAGVRVPRMAEVTAQDSAESLVAKVGLPCLLKPTLIHQVKDTMAGRKVLIAGTERELADHLDFALASSSPWLAQEIVPGPESDIWLVAGVLWEGRIEQAFTARKLRQYPPGFGSASLVESRWNPELVDMTQRVLLEAGYSGIFGAEFKWADGLGYTIIEINPRPTLWFQVTHDAGKCVVLHALSRLTGEPPPPDRPQRDGVRWRYLLKDLYSAAFYRRAGDSFVLPRSTLPQPADDAVRSSALLDWRDPLPLLGEAGNYVAKALSRLR